MARAKPKWRRVLTGRYLRWWVASQAVRRVPALGRWLGFFPRTIGLIEAANEVLADAHEVVPPELIARDRAFLDRCLINDAKAEGVSLDRPIRTGRRAVVIERPWVDMTSGAVLLPDRGLTVLSRGTGNWNAGSIRPGRTRVPVAGTVITPLPTVNYYHLLLESAGFLIDLFESGHADQRPLGVLKTDPSGAVERVLFEAMSARYGVDLHHLPRGVLALPERVICAVPRNDNWEWPPVTRQTADILAALFASHYGAQDPYDKDPHGQNPHTPDLFLSRGTAKLRQLTNAEALESALQDRGVERFVATDGNHPEQIARFRAARRVVSVHGAGLTNIIFCQPGTQVIEIFPQNGMKSPYWWLCQQLGLHHVPVIGSPGDYHLAFEAPVAKVIAALDRA